MPGRRTVFQWLEKHTEFAQLYTAAREAQIDGLLGENVEIADTDPILERARLRIAARLAWIAKLHPRKNIDNRVWQRLLTKLEASHPLSVVNGVCFDSQSMAHLRRYCLLVNARLPQPAERLPIGQTGLTTTVEGRQRRGVEGEGGVKAMGPGIACPFEISGRGADVTNLRSPFN
jgi:hypothetical protein